MVTAIFSLEHVLLHNQTVLTEQVHREKENRGGFIVSFLHKIEEKGGKKE